MLTQQVSSGTWPVSGAGGRLGVLPNEEADKMMIQENLQHDCAVHHSEDRLYLKYDSGSQTWKLQRDHKHTSSKYPAGRAPPGRRILCETPGTRSS